MWICKRASNKMNCKVENFLHEKAMVDVRVLERQETGTLHPSLSRSISPASARIQSKLSPTRLKKQGVSKCFCRQEKCLQAFIVSLEIML